MSATLVYVYNPTTGTHLVSTLLLTVNIMMRLIIPFVLELSISHSYREAHIARTR
jgi:hypothetical protein